MFCRKQHGRSTVGNQTLLYPVTTCYFHYFIQQSTCGLLAEEEEKEEDLNKGSNIHKDSAVSIILIFLIN